MNVTEFVSKAMKDKNFLFEVFTHIPDELLKANEGNEENKGNMGKVFATFLWPGAQAMGCAFSEDELTAECDRQVDALGGFGKAKFFVRMIKTLGKAKPQKK